MKILFLGDIVGKVGRRTVTKNLEKLVKKYQVDFVIANGENTTHGKGLIEKHYYELLDAGIDCITLGNHYLSKDKLLDYIEDADALVRPLNISKRIGGEGSRLFEVNGVYIRVTNVLGTAFMKEEVSSPYYSLKSLIDSLESEDSIHIVDYHAEATGEKMCFGYAFDGLVSAVLGTHTHVQTNDAKILENGTAFISDVGMHNVSSVTASLSPQTTHNRGDIRSSRRLQKLIFILFELVFVDIAGVQALADDVEGKAASEGKPH